MYDLIIFPMKNRKRQQEVLARAARWQRSWEVWYEGIIKLNIMGLYETKDFKNASSIEILKTDDNRIVLDTVVFQQMKKIWKKQ